jgi:hypothetical protein
MGEGGEFVKREKRNFVLRRKLDFVDAAKLIFVTRKKRILLVAFLRKMVDVRGEEVDVSPRGSLFAQDGTPILIGSAIALVALCGYALRVRVHGAKDA